MIVQNIEEMGVCSDFSGNGYVFVCINVVLFAIVRVKVSVESIWSYGVELNSKSHRMGRKLEHNFDKSYTCG